MSTSALHAAPTAEAARPSVFGSPRIWAIASVVVVVIACVRIDRTYTKVGTTMDEPAHIACGMQLLTHRLYTYETQHPPVARVMTALPLFLAGVRSQDLWEMNMEGNAIIYAGDPVRNLALARLGVLPFFIVTCVSIYLWANRISGAATAFFVLLIFTTIPSVLAHAALATTDMAATAGTLTATLIFMGWMEHRTRKRSVLLAVVLGLSLCTKFSVGAFLLLSFAIAWWFERRWGAPRITWKSLKLVVPLTLLTMWACYGFTTASLFSGHPRAAANLAESHPMIFALLNTNVPLAQIPSGIAELAQHMREGHANYLLGIARSRGFALFFPVAVGIKTPDSNATVLGCRRCGTLVRLPAEWQSHSCRFRFSSPD